LFPSRNELISNTLPKVAEWLLKEQSDALKLVTRMMIDICLPVPFRVAMWIANSNLDKIQAKEMAEALIPIVTVEQA
jgi:hypothetical protein